MHLQRSHKQNINITDNSNYEWCKNYNINKYNNVYKFFINVSDKYIYIHMSHVCKTVIYKYERQKQYYINNLYKADNNVENCSKKKAVEPFKF